MKKSSTAKVGRIFPPPKVKTMREGEKRIRIFLYIDPEDYAHAEEIRTSGPVPAAAAELQRTIFKLGLRAWEKGERLK